VRTSRLIQIVPLVAAVACSMGCSTTLTLASDGYFDPWCGSHIPRVYAGTIGDALLATNGLPDRGGWLPHDIPWQWRVAALLDIPLSLAADTAVLPVAVPLELRDSVMCGRAAPSDEKIIIQKSGEEIEIESEE
jgi:uncharacterized protein YceK